MADIPSSLTLAQYTALSSKLKKEFFDADLFIAKNRSNILEHLQGPMGSDKPIVVVQDLAKGGGDTIQFTGGAALGMAPKRGTEKLVDSEEQLRHYNWSVQIDTARLAVSWSQIVKAVANTGKSWEQAYPELVGQLMGRTEQEDMLCRFLQRSSYQNTIRPGNRATRDAIQYDDTLDTVTLGKGVNMLTRTAQPAMIGKDDAGMDLSRFVCLGPNLAFEGLWNDPTFTNALLHAHVDGKGNPYWSGKMPEWRNTLLKRWEVTNPDTPGFIGSSLIPEAILGDASATVDGVSTTAGIATGVTTFDIYGGGVLQSALVNPTNYKPFELFPGAEKRLGLTITTGADAGTYYFVVIDPADGKWNLYSYVGTDVKSNGYKISITARLGPSSDSGVRYTTIKTDGFGGSGATLWTYDTDYNKTAFGVGCVIVPVNVRIVPIADVLAFGANTGAKCYGEAKDKRLTQVGDYDALKGVGVWSIYGNDMRKDSTGSYHRGFIRIQCAYEHPLGALLPQI